VYVVSLDESLSIGELIECTAVNWNDARRRVLKSYREWIRSVRAFLYL